ncbi:carboxylesterase family protein [Kerstersia gyiorum]|jgi:para-nitrobenzyl esterase|uniref:carboxylesterase family protein n=1 Tax=Kerstersia gyiorum TaxID=206506 RepID=UPI00242FBA8F|nr:carboxylesterase family protein [Kerstersia gyiorum]MCH4272251.1 carboxylesterase family protein [Kerstersia gyiorum]MCI1228797.1 carboxylesterase family protein [Kerstersia gyiorum]
MPISSFPGSPSSRARHDGIRLAAWYGLRYACTPARFAGPQPAAGRLDANCLQDVPVFPQLPSKLAAAMGQGGHNPQSEDAFYANVWAPHDAHGLPVLLFIHGGAWMTGGGAMPWHDGSRLAARGMVVITVNYRLGALGHLGNGAALPLPLPAADLLTALRWAYTHASAFGGDPDRITLTGQSAGGWYAHLLSLLPQARGLVHRVALLSMGTRPPWSLEQQLQVMQGVRHHLNGKDPQTVSYLALMQASQQALASLALPAAPNDLAHAPCAFLPVASPAMPSSLLQAGQAALACHATAVYTRCTADESASFFFGSPRHRYATQEEVDRTLAAWHPSDLPASLRHHDRYDGASSGQTPYRQLVAASSWHQFQRFPTEYAAACRQRGIHVLQDEFTEESELPGLHAGHCLDLPFQFGNRKDWADAPMLQGFSEDRFEVIAERLMNSLYRFASGVRVG